MDVIEATRNLGKEMQRDPRFVAFAKSKLNMDSNKELQSKIGEFNIARMNLDRLLDAEEKDEVAVSNANAKLRGIYEEIMADEVMVEYNNTRAEVDKMLAEVLGIIRMCSEGADPETCQMPEAGCSGSCSTCVGCH